MARLQRQIADAQASADAEEVQGSAGGDAVRVRASGEFSFTAIEIDPAVFSAGDVTLLEDLVLAAVRDAAAKLLALRQKAIGDAVSGALGGLFVGFGDEDDEDDEPGGDEPGNELSGGSAGPV